MFNVSYPGPYKPLLFTLSYLKPGEALLYWLLSDALIVMGFNDTSTLVCHFVSSSRAKEKSDSRGDEREGQGRKRNRNETEAREEMKTFPLYPYLLQG